MSTPITIFGSTEHLSGDNLPPRIENLNDKVITTETILSVNPDDTVNANPISAYGKTLLDTVSLADLRTQLLETNEEAVRILPDGNNEINLYIGGTGASNLKLQIKDNSIDVKNSAVLNTANILLGPNNYLKQTINNSGSRVLFESATSKNQYCLYSYQSNTNSGLLVQARDVGNDTVMEINNFRNSDNTYQPISINRSIASPSYVVLGAAVNPTNITTADFVSNGQSVFCNANDVILNINSTNIQPYKNIIPSGSLDIGSGVSPFNNIYNNISTITNEIRMNTFVPVGSDYRQKGIFFRDGFNGSGNGDNMCIRSIARTDPGPPAGVVGDRLCISSYGGLSVNYLTNNAGNDGATGRIALFHDQITIHKDMVGNQDGLISLGTASLKYNNVYSNNIRAHTSLFTNQLRPYSGSTIHIHNADITTDNNRSISVDNLFSSASNIDLNIGNSASDIKMRFINGAGGEIQPYSSIVPPNSDGLIDLGSSSKSFGYLYATSVETSTVTSNDLEANVSIIARGNNAYISAEDDTSTNGKVQMVSENSSTYTGYVSFLKNDTRELFIGYDNALQFENGSNFTIRSNAQTYMSFIHDATATNRKININVDLIPSSNAYDLGNFTNKFVQIHGITINASNQVSTDLISPYAGGSSTSVKINGDLLPENSVGGSGTRNLGNGTHLWKQLFAATNVIDTSDRVTKKDITPIQDALPLVRKLKPVSYIRKAGKRRHTGFIAQDVYEISPWKDQWAAYCDMGNLKGLRYSEFISVNTKAIQELDSKLSKLQKSSVIIHEDGETKSDVNYHTDTSELYERIEALEQQIEEMSDSIGENVVQNVIEIQSDDDRTELTEELERLSRKNDKLEETLNNNDAVIQELVNKINVLENRLKQKQDEETEEESEGGINMVEMLQNRNYEMEQRMNKLEKQNKKLTSNLNKILKQLKNDTN